MNPDYSDGSSKYTKIHGSRFLIVSTLSEGSKKYPLLNCALTFFDKDIYSWYEGSSLVAEVVDVALNNFRGEEISNGRVFDEHKSVKQYDLPDGWENQIRSKGFRIMRCADKSVRVDILDYYGHNNRWRRAPLKRTPAAIKSLFSTYSLSQIIDAALMSSEKYDQLGHQYEEFKPGDGVNLLRH